MTSLEHESNDTSVSASDYGADNWDHENWGEMDVSSFFRYLRLQTKNNFQQTSQDPSSPLADPTRTLGASLNMAAPSLLTSTTPNDIRDGWDNDEWGSLEEEPAIEELEEKENNDTNHLIASRSNSNSNSSSGHYNNNVVNNTNAIKNGDGDTLLNSSSNSNHSNWDNYGTTWNDDEFEPIDDGSAGKN